MKPIFKLLFSIVLLTVLSSSLDKQQVKYQLVPNSDINNFNYQEVTNDPTGTRIYTLNNGLKVYLTKRPNRTRINATIVVNAGASFDPINNSGLAHYLEHALFEGTSKIGGLDWGKERVILDQIESLYELHKNSSNEVEKTSILKKIDSLNYESSKLSKITEYKDLKQSVGSVFDLAITKSDRTRYFSEFTKTQLERFLTLESERFREFIPRNFQNVLEAVYEEYNQESDDIWEIKYEALISTLFEKHPYRISPIGFSEDLKNPSVKAAKVFFDKYYAPNNMALILTGDFDFDNAIKLVEKTFGTLKRKKDIELPQLPKEDPINEIRTVEIIDQNEESVFLGFRYEKGAWSESEKFISIIDRLLENGYAGLFDQDLKGKQKLSDVKSDVEKARDYGIHLLDGYPNNGQSLEEVESLILQQIERIKKGDFDNSLLQAVINEIKINEAEELESKWVGSDVIANSFLYGIPWNERLSYVDNLAKVTKQDIMDFASKFYTSNYAVVYKRKGEKQRSNKVEKPVFTLPVSNKNKASSFAKTIADIPLSGSNEPRFLDFSTDLKTVTLKNEVTLKYIEKKSSPTFNLDIVYQMGNTHSEKLKLAVSLWEKFDVGETSADQLKKELYSLGTKVDFYTEENRTVINIQGLRENLSKSIELIDNLLSSASIHEDSFREVIQQIIEDRSNYKTSKEGVILASQYYGIYGKNSGFNHVLPSETLLKMSGQELTDEIKKLKNVEQEIFYHGEDYEFVVNTLNEIYSAPTTLKIPLESKRYEEQQSTKKVYLVDFNMSQAHIYFITRGPKFNVSNLPYTNMLNFYYRYEFSDEIDRRSLAYSAYAYHYESKNKEGFDAFRMYAGTQIDKYDDALKFMSNVIRNIPQSEESFKQKKENLLKRFEDERIEGRNIYWTYRNLQRQGLDYDVREKKYKAIKSMTLEDITNYHKSFIEKNGYNIVIVGDTSKMNFSLLEQYGEVVKLTQDDLFGVNY